ncbi:MAG: glutamate---cysteine ligase / carboxylate-amine ligase [Thermoleophilaceae bacterium]|jgi:carboxylate-amine ligase|nr:glutamate---cysteine ligase / carboxylate-amine ligase [Thermoleophilaceae bacterium]MEA2369026.1 glutamate---cysteine ligase / carboxylate-amine ligase [Thermoleophilaceae bacterium]MEA2389246.1 glutamate---cysteine ligase / carboxylate-amine ligase [Thermoleophilaceae bacterium]
MLDMKRAREIFEDSTDFTVGIEEEFGILDPDTRSLTPRYEELSQAAQADEVLKRSVAGELISSEIEIRSDRGETFADAVASQRENRARLFRLAAEHDVLLMATGTHPWSPWWEQQIIETDHYQRLLSDLGYVARRNNTFSLHVHVGIRGADRAISVCNRLRRVLPEILAVSANSPFLDGFDSGLASARSQIFTRSFPRCGVPDPFDGFADYAEHVDFLVRTHSIVEHTQLWWSVRPHHAFGTVEIRICDAQSSAEESTALAGLLVSCAAQAALDHDEGVPDIDAPPRLVEENLWRAIRFGLDGRTIDLERGEEFPSAALPDRLLAWTAPARGHLGIEPALPGRNGAQRQRDALEGGAAIAEVFATEVETTRSTYAGQEVTT